MIKKSYKWQWNNDCISGKKKENVIQFHKTALINRGFNEGFPGPRNNDHFYAYIRDLEGNKIYAFCST